MRTTIREKHRYLLASVLIAASASATTIYDNTVNDKTFVSDLRLSLVMKSFSRARSGC